MVNINKNPPWFRTAAKCRYSGLPVTHPDIYISCYPEADYFVDVAKLGDRILLVKGSGYVRYFEMAEALCFMDDYTSAHFNEETGVFMIEDYADIEGADFKARKAYIDHHKHSGMLWGGVLYSLPMIFRISFNIAKRLHVYGKHLYAVDSFKQAIALAQSIVSHYNDAGMRCQSNESDFLSLPIKPGKTRETIFTRLAATPEKYISKLASRYRENITRKYSQAILAFIESIDWYEEAVDIPHIPDASDKSVRKVFEAIGYIKSEIHDLLKERDAAEQILRKSEARYRQLVEHSQAGILEYDYKTNRIISVNDSFLAVTGYSMDEIASMDPLRLMTAESRKIFDDRLSKLMAGEKMTPDSVYGFFTKNGRKKWVLLNTNVTRKDGRPWKADIVITDITHLKEVEAELRDYQEKLRQLSIQLTNSEESQRRQLASRLHESVSQELFAAQLKLNSLENALNDSRYSDQVDEIMEQIVKSIRQIKVITYDLSPPVLYDLGLKEAVESLVKSVEKKCRQKMKARFAGRLDCLEDEIKFSVYRVIKEILQNAVKHARANFIDIVMEKTDMHLKVDVIDNGVGFDVDSLSEGYYTADGFGLFDIREKIHHLGGHITITSRPGSGTRVSFSVPTDDTAFWVQRPGAGRETLSS